MPSTRKELEKDFEDFLKFCEKQKFTKSEFREICKPLVSSWRWRFWKRILTVIVIIAFIWWLCSNVGVISWSTSAIGRLLLIELLPFWNWTPLYNAKCLVNRNYPAKETTLSEGKYETDKTNCVMCERFEMVVSLSNVTYSMIEHAYLEKGLPIVINDSHPLQSLDSFLEDMLTSSSFLDSEPCNIETNLVMKKFFTVAVALDKINENDDEDEWFLQLRNCQFTAVKASRKFIRRPYYYPLHFEPFYSSWVLLSNRYEGVERELYVQGLVFIQQLSGDIIIHLIPKTPCDSMCLEVELSLKAGECLVFSTDLWILNYRSVGVSESVSTIIEIDWHY